MYHRCININWNPMFASQLKKQINATRVDGSKKKNLSGSPGGYWHKSMKSNVKHLSLTFRWFILVKIYTLTRKLLIFYKMNPFKMAEHSFRARFYRCNSARTQGAIILFTQTRTICAIFLYYWTQCIDGFSLLLQRYVRKGNDAKIPAIFVVNKRTQLNAAHAQLLEKLRPIAFAETCRFLTTYSLEFKQIWQNNSSETMWMIYRKKSEFWHREILIIQNMQWKRLTANYENRLCQTLLEQRWQKGFYVSS